MPETAEEKRERERREADADRDRDGRRGPTDEGRGVARKLLNRFRGKAEDALAQLADENKDLREDRRDLREKIKGFETPGTVVLTADDAKEYDAFKALGKKAADVKKELDGVPALRDSLLKHDRRVAAEEAAPLAGYNTAALRELITDKGLEITFKSETKDGKEVRTPLVKVASDDKAQPVPLVDYAKQHLSAYLPALTAKAPAGGNTVTPSTTTRPGTPMVEQSSSASTAQNGDKPRPVSAAGAYMTPSQRNAKQNTTS